MSFDTGQENTVWKVYDFGKGTSAGNLSMSVQSPLEVASMIILAFVRGPTACDATYVLQMDLVREVLKSNGVQLEL
jgi:hypothetical protein